MANVRASDDRLTGEQAHGGITDNIYFNSTIMQKSLNVVNVSIYSSITCVGLS